MNNKKISGYLFLDDIYGRPGAVLNFTTARDIYLFGRNTVTYFLLLILIISFFAGTIIANLGIGEIKKAEKALAAEKDLLEKIISSIADGVIFYDLKGNIILYNDAAKKILAYGTEELKGKSITDVFKIIDQEMDKPIQNQEKHLLDITDKKSTLENKILTKQSERRIVTFSLAPVKDNVGTTLGYVLVFRDVTEQKTAEANRVFSHKMESIGRLAAGVAHEINSPMQCIYSNIVFLRDKLQNTMNFIKGYDDTLKTAALAGSGQNTTDRLKEKELQEMLTDVPEAINDLLQAVQSVCNTINALKEFVHPGEKEKKPADINAAIKRALTLTGSEWKKVAEVETDLAPDLPLVDCVINEINQVLVNMIVNAAQAIEEKGLKDVKGKIKIATKLSEEKVQITIADTGKGIADDVLNRIFDPFFTTKPIGKGTGQGLTISYDIIVNRHQGHIEVESVENQGTVFTITLPVRKTGNKLRL